MTPFGIRPVDGISTKEIEAALAASTLWLTVGSRWSTQNGGFVDAVFTVSTNPIVGAAPAALDFYSPANGGAGSPLTRAIEFNGGRPNSDPRVQRIYDALKALPVPACGAPRHVVAWQQHP